MPEKPVEEVIDLAIQREQDAYFFYKDIAELIKEKDVIDTLEWIANEEFKHRKFLRDYKNGKYGKAALRLTDVMDYGIAEHVAAPEISPRMDSAEVFALAAHRELASYTFYTELAKLHTDRTVADLLTRIANEERKHKEKMEYLYSNTAFPQTAGGGKGP